MERDLEGRVNESILFQSEPEKKESGKTFCSLGGVGVEHAKICHGSHTHTPSAGLLTNGLDKVAFLMLIRCLPFLV
ncbi:hypothetical protein COLO4_06469 [Corchorus olitorius]|uniref:Uncharacterized protein n=1 Tax=Corchorus olitorius TaxID=93759 RepID=A0A1R3KMZ5_9ROSI|nr:hypothetical protein COLO4_06469 [Corchorus olitorius]